MILSLAGFLLSLTVSAAPPEAAPPPVIRTTPPPEDGRSAAPPPIVRTLPSRRVQPPEFVGPVPSFEEMITFLEGAVEPGEEVMETLLNEEVSTALVATAEPALRCMAEGIKSQPEFGSRTEFDEHRAALRLRCKAVEARTQVAEAIAAHVPEASAEDRSAWATWLLTNLLLWASLSQ